MRRVMFLVFLAAFFILSNTTSFCLTNFKYLEILPSRHSLVTKLVNKKGQTFFLKQTKECRDFDYIQPVIEALSIHVAQAIGIPTAPARIIPESRFDKKSLCKNKAALLQRAAPGLPLTHIPEFPHIDLRQIFDDTLPQSQGFSRETIQSMTHNPQLARIVALDLFVGNRDRTNYNLFYDKTKKLFYTIDFDASFVTNLCKWAVIRLLDLTKKNTKFSKKELRALTICKQTLEKLIKRFPASVLLNQLEIFLKEAGLTANSSARRLADYRISQTKHFIAKTCEYAPKLVKAIEHTLKNN